MKRAFQLAQLGKFTVAPNPRVGAVIVHENKIIGEGFHQAYGQPHAEVNAVNSVKDKRLLSEATIYVSLEPCAHFGKTPPCARLLEKHQFKRVVIANQDPFEQVDGNGISILKNAGIKVESSVLDKEGQFINRRFFTFHQKKRPYLILKWAESKDGFIYNEQLEDNWITHPISKQLVHLWRAEEDAILVGKNTVMADNPSLTVREVVGKNPCRIIIDEQLQLDQTATVFQGDTPTLVLNEKEEIQKGNVQFIRVKTRDQLAQVVCNIGYQKRLQSVIIEGGKQTLEQFIQAGLWDEARIFKGDRLFEKGIQAPYIEGKLAYQTDIESDKLSILINSGR